MRNKDEDVALRALTAAVESHTQFLRLVIDKVEDGFTEVLARLDGITTRLDEFHAEFATHRHGDDGEVI